MAANAIDLDHLARYTGGEKDLNAEILRLFDGQVTEHGGASCNALLASRDSKRWREITHTIKGAARGVGAFAMGEAAAEAEPVDPADSAEAQAAIEKLEREAQTVRAFIQTIWRLSHLSARIKPATAFFPRMAAAARGRCQSRAESQPRHFASQLLPQGLLPGHFYI